MPIESLSAVASASFTPLTALADTLTAGSASTGAAGATATTSFGDTIVGALEDLSATHNRVDMLATAAATGQLADVHDYTIAATEASLATELTVAVRNKAIEAFTQIMNLPL